MVFSEIQYVTIEVIDTFNGLYRWSNQDGSSWTLTQDQNSPDLLTVGEDCYDLVNFEVCYLYGFGIREFKLVFKDGKVTGFFHGGLLWAKTGLNIVGEYEIDGDYKNDFLYVTISVVDAVNGVYKWSNRFGMSW